MIDESRWNGGRTGCRLWRLFAANWRRLLVDAVVLGAWVGFLAFAFLQSDYPRWAFYALLFLGVVLNTLATRGWRVPEEVDRDG